MKWWVIVVVGLLLMAYGLWAVDQRLAREVYEVKGRR